MQLLERCSAEYCVGHLHFVIVKNRYLGDLQPCLQTDKNNSLTSWMSTHAKPISEDN